MYVHILRCCFVVFFLSEWLVLCTCVLRQYHFVNQHLTWTEAQTYCRQTHTDLATIENSEELNQLISTVSSAGHSSDVWLGLYSEIDWRWSDGSGAQYRNWYNYYNSNFNDANQCMLMWYYGQWINEGCMTSYPFICYNGKTIKQDLFHYV